MTRGEGTGVARALCDLKLQRGGRQKWEKKKEENEKGIEIQSLGR